MSGKLKDMNDNKFKSCVNLIIGFLLGAIILCVLSVIQKTLMHGGFSFQSFILPGIYGGMFGMSISLLVIKNKKLVHLNEKLRVSDEIIKQVNEELLASDEEIRQSNDVLHSLNELLISQNEELETTFNKLKETQSQLVQSEKMASVGILTAGVAHELNNPLNFIQGGKTVIENYILDNIKEHAAELLPLIEIIDLGINRATQIVQSLNHFSRKGDTKTENCNIHSIINNCLIMIHNLTKNKVEITKQFTEVPFSILGNEGKLHQVFLNVLTNAVQAIEKQGEISITTNVIQNYITIEIEDTGCGISHENLEKVIDPFFTTKEPGKGTGLGLSIVYNIIKEHNGTINFESEINTGTIVSIKLPLNK